MDGSVDPSRDVEVIELELALSDLVTVEKMLSAVQGKLKASRAPEHVAQASVLERWQAALSAGKLARSVELTPEERELMKGVQLLTLKPVLYVVNVDEESAKDPAWVSPLGPDRLAVPISVKTEAELSSLAPAEAVEMLEMLGMKESGLDRVISKCYELLDLITFITTGEKETRAWTVRRGAKAPEAAGVIHTDFVKNFIRAEVISYEDFVALGGESGARDKGKLRIEGKEYVMRDGDVCHFRVNP